MLKEGCDEVLEAFDNHFREELIAYQGRPYIIHRAEVKEEISWIRNLIQNCQDLERGEPQNPP